MVETTIDRTSYRRSNRVNLEEIKHSNHVVNQKQGWLKSTFYQEIILAMSILIGILCVKILDLSVAENWLKEKINSGVSYQVLSTTITQKYQNLKKLLENSYWQETIPLSGDSEKVESRKNEDKEMEIIVNEEPQAITTAIEGSNQLIDDANKIKESYQLISPITGGIITSKFGIREDQNPIVSNYHTGLDLAIDLGTTIVATHDGVITEAGTIGGYGNCIMIESGDLATLYGHCSEISVKKGDFVKQGEKIGEVGMTGNATGPHVHFEIRYQGRYVNPEDVIS